MAQWWPPLSPALDGGRACAAIGAWLPGTSVASVVEELKLDCATLQRQRCVYGCALAECRDRMRGPPRYTHVLHGSSNQKEETTAEIARPQRHRERHVFAYNVPPILMPLKMRRREHELIGRRRTALHVRVAVSRLAVRPVAAQHSASREHSAMLCGGGCGSFFRRHGGRHGQRDGTPVSAARGVQHEAQRGRPQQHLHLFCERARRGSGSPKQRHLSADFATTLNPQPLVQRRPLEMPPVIVST